MKLSKFKLFGALILTSCSLSLFAQDDTMGTNPGENNEEDFRAVRQYIESKRQIAIKDKGGNLKIGGDVRVSYNKVHQVLNGQQVEGRGFGGNRDLRSDYAGTEANIPGNYLDIEASLSLEYKNDKSFANILLRMANRGGIDGTNFSDSSTLVRDSRIDYKSSYAPTKNRLDLARAFIGYDLWEMDSHKIVGNLGRQRLYDLFDSRVMFVNRFDGLALKYNGGFEGIGRAHATYGVFIVSDRVNHEAQAVEVGLSQVLDTDLAVKYALVDWSHRGTYSDGSRGNAPDSDACNRPGVNPRYQYMHEACRYTVSQLQASYEITNDWTYGMKVKAYAAGLYNHKARGMKRFYINQAEDKLNNFGWYAGLTLGRITMPGDWVFDACYQYVEAQAVPDFDSYGGAGRGNLTGVFAVVDHSQGNTNYQGVRAQLAYCVTADIMANLKVVHTTQIDSNLSNANNVYASSPVHGSSNKYDSAEIGLVYSF